MSLLDLGFTQTWSDASVYFKFDGTDITLVIVYVDNVLFMGSNPKLIQGEKGKFMKVWESIDLGEAKEYLGMRITHDRKKRTLTLDQCIYAEKVLKQFGMQNAKPARTPLPTGYNPKISDIEATSDIHSQYQSVIGSLLYIMLGTQPDIAYAVIRMSQFCADPSQEHLSRALYIIRYLGSTKNLALPCDGANHNGFLGYTDSDWAANPDDQKSITGYVLFLTNSPVSWLTRWQKTVALSSTEAEYMAMSDTTRQISWIKSLLGEIHFSIPKVLFYCDNQGAIFLATNPAQEQCFKHNWNMLSLHLWMHRRRR